MERVSDYPTNLWLLLAGVIAIASPASIEGGPDDVGLASPSAGALRR